MTTLEQSKTVWHAFYDVLRAFGMTTVFGTPASTEQPMLKNFPADFKYIPGLQEASVVSMAGGFSEATRKPVLVSLQASAETGNAMGAIMTAFQSKIPLIVIAEQQTRGMLLGEPVLTDRDATMLPRPYVKWYHEPIRAVDVPAAAVRAISMAVQSPKGPVYLSIPLDAWNTQVTNWDFSHWDDMIVRAVGTRYGPDPQRLAVFAHSISIACNPALVLGAEVDKSLAWNETVKLAETLQCAVFRAPFAERAVFPETHALFEGPLPAARGPLATCLEPFDLILVIGAEVPRCRPRLASLDFYDGIDYLQITEDPDDAGKAMICDSIVSDVGFALEGLNRLLRNIAIKRKARATDHTSHVKIVMQKSHPGAKATMTAFQAFSTVAELRPSNSILVYDTTLNNADLLHAWPTVIPESSFTCASGGLGWNGPAAVGIALAQKLNNTGRTTVLAIGAESFQCSVQSVHVAVQYKTKLIYLVPIDEEHATLEESAQLEDTPDPPTLSLPGLSISAIAEAFGCPAYRAETIAQLHEHFKAALQRDGPVLIEFPVDRTLCPLVAQTASKA